MRLLLVSPYFPPQPAVASLRVHSFATEWARAGAEVTVLTTRKRDDQGGWPKPARGFRVVEVPFGVPRVLEKLRGASRTGGGGEPAETRGPRGALMRLGRLRETRGVFGSSRMPDLTDWWVRPAARWAAGQARWDVVYSSAGPYTAHLVALAIRKPGHAARWAAEFRDLWVDNPLHRGLFPFTIRERALERRCLRMADLLVTVSEPLRARLARKARREAIVVYNGFDPDELAAIPAARLLPRDGAVRLVFTGSYYATGQDPAPLLGAMRSLRAEEPALAARLRLVVAGASCEAWAAAAARFGVADLLENRGTVGREDARRLQRDADALLLLDFEPNVEGALTTKLFEYLSVEAPILLVGGEGETSIRRLLDEAGRGVLLGRDETAIARTLRSLLAGTPLLESAPNAALIETYSRRNQARRLLERLTEWDVGDR